MSKVKTVFLWLMAFLYVGAGANHFINADFYIKMMPPYLPWHGGLVYLSGIAEIVLGVAVLVPQTRSLAAWGLIALLVAVFPVHIHMVMHPEAFPDISIAGLYIRLPFQAVFIAWAWWFSGPVGVKNHP